MTVKDLEIFEKKKRKKGERNGKTRRDKKNMWIEDEQQEEIKRQKRQGKC